MFTIFTVLGINVRSQRLRHRRTLFFYNLWIQHGGRANSLGGSDSRAIYRSALKYILDKYANLTKVIFNGTYTIYMAGVCA